MSKTLTSSTVKIVIIGAGPAGCSTSFFLSKNKIPHIILDKAVFPRDKVCGDGLAPKTVHILKKFNPQLVEKMHAQSEKFAGGWGGMVVSPEGNILNIPIQKTEKDAFPPGFVATRFDFDYFLTQQLDGEYATFIQGATIQTLTPTSEGTTLTYQIEGETHTMFADMVIGADGDRSIVQKTYASRPKQPRHYGAGLRAYYSGVKDLHPQHFIEFYFLKDINPGYFWIFPLPNGRANVGVCMISSFVSAQKINLREAMLNLIQTHPLLKNRFESAELEGKIVGWGLPMGSKPTQLSGNGFLLTGDAASLIDPISGEGIGNALYSGWLAAEALVQALEKQDFSPEFFKIAYDKRLYRCIGGDLKLSYTFQRLCRYPWLINFIVRKAQKNKVFMETMSCIFDDLAIREKLYSPLFYLRLLVGFFR